MKIIKKIILFNFYIAVTTIFIMKTIRYDNYTVTYDLIMIYCMTFIVLYLFTYLTLIANWEKSIILNFIIFISWPIVTIVFFILPNIINEWSPYHPTYRLFWFKYPTFKEIITTFIIAILPPLFIFIIKPKKIVKSIKKVMKTKSLIKINK